MELLTHVHRLARTSAASLQSICAPFAAEQIKCLLHYAPPQACGATLTILDANVTTLIAALVLFQFGTGPVKGFAVTLSLGVIASMFTALIVSRIIFDYILMNRKVKSLSI